MYYIVIRIVSLFRLLAAVLGGRTKIDTVAPEFLSADLVQPAVGYIQNGDRVVGCFAWVGG